FSEMLLQDSQNEDEVGKPLNRKELMLIKSSEVKKEPVSLGIGTSSVVICAGPIRDLALKVFYKGNLRAYQKRLTQESNIRTRIRPEMEALGFSDSPITHLGTRTFTIYNERNRSLSSLTGECRVEKKLLEDGLNLKTASLEELYSLFACLVHQLDILHKNNIIHADIKPETFCKTPDGLFELIDMDESIIADDPKIYSRRELNFAVTPQFIQEEEYGALKRAETPEETMTKGRSLDILALGTTMYQIAYAFNKKIALIDCSMESFPHTYKSNEMIKSLKDKEKLRTGLGEIDSDLKEVIIRMLSVDPSERPSLEELKQAFPLSLIRR
ncbi:MAG: hypothetical protein JSS09_05990, partial [Verrucomicrobia bacterium]|nr:hypothetical protein [Verrucomicrobiota bacterium]